MEKVTTLVLTMPVCIALKQWRDVGRLLLRHGARFLFLLPKWGSVCLLAHAVGRWLHWFIELPMDMADVHHVFMSHCLSCLSASMFVIFPFKLFSSCYLHPLNICGMFCILFLAVTASVQPNAHLHSSALSAFQTVFVSSEKNQAPQISC